jgi:hypothetical protein
MVTASSIARRLSSSATCLEPASSAVNIPPRQSELTASPWSAIIVVASATPHSSSLSRHGAICGTEFAPQQILPANAGALIGASGVGEFTGRVVFALGVLGKALSTITLSYISWFILQNSSKLLGDDRPQGMSAIRWNAAMGIALTVTLISVGYAL